ncbi:hypothetical protein BC628DRAFT_1356740 [Trametes gibbosa]|nr:hypothetical protein BC628DRAFT_1356740 [Trametes gibbosa]
MRELLTSSSAGRVTLYDIWGLGFELPELWSNLGAASQELKCCYIFPEVLGGYTVEDIANKHTIATTWKILDRLGHHHLLDGLSGANVHRLDVILTLTHSLLTRFDSMDLWLQPVPDHINNY